jgi:hypothetical protein
MRILKKVAGGADTIGDLKEFIAAATQEGFTDDHRLNGGATVGLFVQVNDDRQAPLEDYTGKCVECLRRVPATKEGVAKSHLRGDTVHSGECSGSHRRVTQLGPSL